MTGRPLISVIIPTYNWSAALHVALQSVRDQTLADFEVWVIGDGCTDDSEAVVRSFADPRFHWENLDRNHGSQWAANNRGLERARSKYVAYLGHDDVWWPTHLQRAVATLEQTGTDVAASIALFYGPPESGIRAVTGCFPNNAYGPQLFVPPSSIAHRTDLVQRAGPWRSMRESRYSVDNDFMIRAREAGATIVSTGEVTTFKFSAGWRRNAYRRKDVSDQRRHLERIRAEGESFRLAELTAGLAAAANNKFLQLEMPLSAEHEALAPARRRWAFKGSRPRERPLQPIDERTRLYPDDESEGFEWHGWEDGPAGKYRWSGPSVVSTLALPVALDGTAEVTLLIISEIAEGTLASASLAANGVDVAMTARRAADGTWRWTGCLPPTGPGILELTIRIERAWRPFDRGLNEDRRWLGLAVGWIELDPLAPETPVVPDQAVRRPA
jgi:glycosyltransferase involved in cell wall biosynthesis